MASAETAADASDRMLELVGRLERAEGFAEVVESLRGGTRRLWTESGDRRARWPRPLLPHTPPPRWSSFVRWTSRSMS